MVIKIANKLGKPIAMELLNGAFARTCIKVDLTKPLIVGAIMGEGEEKFVYEFIYEGIAI